MTHDIHRVERFEIVGPYTLALSFDDGTEQRIDFRPVLEGELFGPLQNPNVFIAVSLDKEVGTLIWPERSGLRSDDTARLAAGPR
jgi:hypothetical protein